MNADERSVAVDVEASGRRDWYRLATVRAGDTLVRAADGGTLPFSRELASHVTHPMVRGLGPGAEHDLLRRALVRYLHATSVLEVSIVQPVAAEVSHTSRVMDARMSQRLDALKLGCDESYHAVLASQLLADLGCAEPRPPVPTFTTRLDLLCQRVAATTEDAARIRFLFTVVTEMTISASLRTLAHDALLLPAVRHFVADHAKDEAWHGSFFGELFSEFWAQQGEAARTHYRKLLPQLICLYLDPDLDAITADLSAVGITEAIATQVAREAYSAERVECGLRAATRPLVAHLGRDERLRIELAGPFSATHRIEIGGV